VTHRLGEDLSELFVREITRLAAEVSAYPDEEQLWMCIGGQKNSPGTLALHLVGNLDAYIGNVLGSTGYIRDRDAEFTERVSRDELLRRIALCRSMLGEVLPQISDDAMQEEFPGTPPTRMTGIRTHPFLMHLLWHLGWHLGHIYYHRLSLEGTA